MPPFALHFDTAPYRLSGVVYGALMNHQPQLDALGDAVHQPPYKAPPQAPVLALRPRNTLAGDGAVVVVPQDADTLALGAQLGIVIGRSISRVGEAQALQAVAGYTTVTDLWVPHASHYRPAVRFKARDGFCIIGPAVVPASALPHPDALDVQVCIDGQVAQRSSTGQRVRGVARLIADISEFMTLQPGDLLLLGPAHPAPLVRAGQAATITITGLGVQHSRYARAGMPAANPAGATA